MGMGKANKSDKAACETVPTCARCTALVRAGLERCSMCSWPLNADLPSAVAEHEVVPVARAEPEPAVVVETQLDALGTMSDGQTGVEATPGEPVLVEAVPAFDTGEELAPPAVALDPLTAPIEQL